jgi:hypothetical protein
MKLSGLTIGEEEVKPILPENMNTSGAIQKINHFFLMLIV